MNHFTRSPWEVSPKESKDGSLITCRILAKVGGNPICSIWNKKENEAEANAKLIAAAPDLLEALSFCQSVIKSQGMFDRSEQIAFEKAEAAIEKATK